MANKPFETYFDERLILTGNPPPEGDMYLVLRSGVVYKTSFGQTRGFAAQSDNGVATNIVTVDTWTDIGNTLVEVAITPTLVFAANEFTYGGINQTAPTSIRAAITASKVDPGAEVFKLGISINGATPTSTVAFTVTDTETVFAAVEFQRLLQAADTIKMQIYNDESDGDIIIKDAQLSVG